MTAAPVRISRNKWFILIASTMVLLTLLACTFGGLLQSGGQEESGPVGGEETVVPGGGGGAGEEPPPPEDPPPPDDEEPDPSEEEEGDTDPSDPLVCPVEVTTYELTAFHNFWTDTGMGLWNWEATGGLIFYIEGAEIVGGPAEGTFTGSQYGAFSDGESQCSFEAPATIQVSVFGTCQDGVITLDITEDWQMGTYTWICPNPDDEPDIAMFGLPSFGPAVHPGLAFKLFGDFTPDTVEIPWFGDGGGTKSWTLVNINDPID